VSGAAATPLHVTDYGRAGRRDSSKRGRPGPPAGVARRPRAGSQHLRPLRGHTGGHAPGVACMAWQARQQAVLPGAAVGRRRWGIPAPRIAWPGWTAPAGQSRSAAHSRSCADPSPPPGAP